MENRVFAYELAQAINHNELKDVTGGNSSWHLTGYLTGGLDLAASSTVHIDEKFD